MHLVRERNLENVVNFTEITYIYYLSLMEKTYSNREYEIILQHLKANINSKCAVRLQRKFENDIVDEIIVMNYLNYLIEEGKGAAA